MGNTVSIALQVNGRPRRYGGDGEQPLLWYLRDELRLTGSKYGCGVGQCGACTVHVNGNAARSCVTRMASLQGARVRSIEDLAAGDVLHPVQQAWIEEDVAHRGPHVPRRDDAERASTRTLPACDGQRVARDDLRWPGRPAAATTV